MHSLFHRIQKIFFINVLVAFNLISTTHRLHSQTATGLNFDGVDDRCIINDNAAYNLGTANFSVEMWVKAFSPQTNSYPAIFNKKSGSTGLNIFLDPLGRVGFSIAGATAIFGGADVDDNVCHHIAVVRSSLSAIGVYVDGILTGTTTGFNYGSINSAVNITIGNFTSFKGWIHEVRFWNTARTQTQIQNSKNGFLAGNETGLIGYWRMNEGSGQTINDLSPTNNDGFLGTVNTTDSADPLFVSNSCMCPHPVITSSGGAVCAGQTPALSTPLVSGYTYQWKLNGAIIAGATSQIYVASTAGNYTCQATAFGCSGTSNILAITSGPPAATITAGGPVTFCTPNNVVLSANTGTMLSYQWKLNGGNITGATNSTFTTSTAGNYTCAVTNNCGSSNSNTITVTVNPSPTASITAGGSTTFCTGGSVLLTAAAGTGYVYQWRLNGNNISGASSQTYSAGTSGSYTVVVTKGSCTATSNSIAVTVQQQLSPSISVSGMIFCGSSPVDLHQDLQGTNFTYQWFEDNHAIPGATAQDYSTLHNGTFGCTVGNACGTFPSPQFSLNDPFLAQFPRAIISANGPLSLCAPGSVNMSVDDSWNYSSFQWYKDGVIISGATVSNYTATQQGSYCCLMVANSCPHFSNWLTFTIGTFPSATITPVGPTTFCSGSNVVLNAVVAANRTYQWKKNNTNISGATLSSYTATATGNYKVTVTNTQTGCSKTTTVATVVTVNAKPAAAITPQGPTTFCSGGSVVLSANTGTGLTYKWKKNNNIISGATLSNYTATTQGTYRVEVTNSNGCTKLSAGVTVTVPCKEGKIMSPGNNFDFTVYPNPNAGEFTIEFSTKPASPIQIEMTDAIGKIVKRFETNNESVVIKETNLANGIYCLTARSNDKVVLKKINIVK